MRHASLFSGIGGFDLAAEWMGWTNVFSCEIEEFPRKVLQHHFPNTIHYEDIKQTDFTIHRGEIDILTGGFPCQPYSSAGKRLGKEDERHLWPEMLRAVRETQPTFVVGENVRGFLTWNGGLVLDEVFADLEDLGYGVEAFVLPAAGINAPHRRDRVWIVASNTERIGHGGSAKETRDDSQEFSRRVVQGQRYNWNEVRSETQRCGSVAPNANNERLTEQFFTAKPGEEARWHSQDNTQRSKHKDWQEFPTQSPVYRRDDGFPSRSDGITVSKWERESVKAYGNAIVPQLAYRIFKAIEQCQ